jgi:hypothetical protein
VTDNLKFSSLALSFMASTTSSYLSPSLAGYLTAIMAIMSCIENGLIAIMLEMKLARASGLIESRIVFGATSSFGRVGGIWMLKGIGEPCRFARGVG